MHIHHFAYALPRMQEYATGLLHAYNVTEVTYMQLEHHGASGAPKGGHIIES